MSEMKPKRRKHHYVPIWFQKGFLPEGQKALKYLHLKPYKTLPDGNQVKLKEIYEFGPRSCFQEKDLYTTKMLGIRNDEIEEYLFGKIDDDKAVGRGNGLNGAGGRQEQLYGGFGFGGFELLQGDHLDSGLGLDGADVLEAHDEQAVPDRLVPVPSGVEDRI